MYPTKPLWEILDKNFSIWKIPVKEYLKEWTLPIIDQWKNFIWWYTNDNSQKYNWNLPVLVYWDHTNSVKFIDFDFVWWADGIKIFKFWEGIDVKYMFYVINYYKPENLWYRRHFPILKQIQIPLPPLPTQQKIVFKLDKIFAKIDKNIELTKQNIANIEEENNAILEKIFKECEKEFGVEKLWNIFEITSSKRVFKSEWKNEWIPFYRAREIVKLAKYDHVDNELFITKEMFNEYKKKYWVPKMWDIMITWVWTLWVPYVVKENDEFYFKDWNIIWFKKNSKEVLSRFIEYWFYSEYIKKQVNETSGTSVWTYTIIRAKNTKIPLPPLPNQQKIVEKLDKIFAKNSELKNFYEKNLKNLEELKQSILKQAFEDEDFIK